MTFCLLLHYLLAYKNVSKLQIQDHENFTKSDVCFSSHYQVKVQPILNQVQSTTF